MKSEPYNTARQIRGNTLSRIKQHQKYSGQVYYFKSAKTGIDVNFYIPEEPAVDHTSCR